MPLVTLEAIQLQEAKAQNTIESIIPARHTNNAHL
jgi:hypothetical protein